MKKLDHDGFLLPDPLSFSLLLSMYGKACQVSCPHTKCMGVQGYAFQYLQDLVGEVVDQERFCCHKIFIMRTFEFSAFDGRVF